MAQVYKDIIRLTVDLKTGAKEVIAPIKQADNLSRVLRCQLINNGKPINLKGSQLLLYVIKADYKQCVINGVINEGKTGIVDFELTEQSLILAEEIQCEIVKIDEGDVLLSFPIFKIGIDGALYDNELVESTNEFSALTALISNVASWENRFVERCEELDDKIDREVDEVNTQLSRDKQDLINRIDNIIALPDGTTTADAELIDIRLGNQRNFTSAGEAVRKPLKSVSERKFTPRNIDGKLNVLNDLTLFEKKVYDTNSSVNMQDDVLNMPTNNHGFSYSPLQIRDELGLIYSDLYLSHVINQGVPIAIFYGYDGKAVKVLYGEELSETTNVKLPIPDNAYYVGFIQWYQTTSPKDFTIKQEKIKLEWLDSSEIVNESVNIAFNEVAENISERKITPRNIDGTLNVLSSLTLFEKKTYDTNSSSNMTEDVANMPSNNYGFSYSPLQVRDDFGLIYSDLYLSHVIKQGVPIAIFYGKDEKAVKVLYGNQVEGSANVKLPIPSNAYYVGFIQWYQTTSPEYFTVKQKKVKLEWLDLELPSKDSNNLLTVKKDGTGDYTSIVEAIKNINDASETNVYDVKIYSGDYNIFEELGGEAYFKSITNDSNWKECGINLKPYINLIGVGQVTLRCEVESSQTSSIAVTKSSLLNMYGTNKIENLKMICKNMRYVIHDESEGITDYYYHNREITNCELTHRGNDSGFWSQSNPYACGFDVGNKIIFKNTTFIALGWGNAVSFHDRVSNTDATTIEIDNCKFISKGQDSLRFGTVGQGNQHMVYINNSDFSDRIVLNEETESSGVGCSYKVVGGNNTKAVHLVVHTNSQDTSIHYPIFANEKSYVCCRNEAWKIQKHKVYSLDNKGKAYPTIATGNRFDYIALEDIAKGSSGVVFHRGYIDQSILGVTTSVGDSVSFVNGKFVVSEENVVGVNDGASEGYILIF